MKLLLDECVPKRLRNDFPGHEVSTIEEVGLKGLKNGELLRAAAEQFDALITVDRRMPTQQNLAQFNLALIVPIARPCRYQQLKLLAPKALEHLIFPQPGSIIVIQ
jgi:predicted nuclease of predicted toxin-antitoxin system